MNRAERIGCHLVPTGPLHVEDWKWIGSGITTHMGSGWCPETWIDDLGPLSPEMKKWLVSFEPTPKLRMGNTLVPSLPILKKAIIPKRQLSHDGFPMWRGRVVVNRVHQGPLPNLDNQIRRGLSMPGDRQTKMRWVRSAIQLAYPDEMQEIRRAERQGTDVWLGSPGRITKPPCTAEELHAALQGPPGCLRKGMLFENQQEETKALQILFLERQRLLETKGYRKEEIEVKCRDFSLWITDKQIAKIVKDKNMMMIVEYMSGEPDSSRERVTKDNILKKIVARNEYEDKTQATKILMQTAKDLITNAICTKNEMRIAFGIHGSISIRGVIVGILIGKGLDMKFVFRKNAIKTYDILAKNVGNTYYEMEGMKTLPPWPLPLPLTGRTRSDLDSHSFLGDEEPEVTTISPKKMEDIISARGTTKVENDVGCSINKTKTVVWPHQCAEWREQASEWYQSQAQSPSMDSFAPHPMAASSQKTNGKDTNINPSPFAGGDGSRCEDIMRMLEVPKYQGPSPFGGGEPPKTPMKPVTKKSPFGGGCTNPPPTSKTTVTRTDGTSYIRYPYQPGKGRGKGRGMGSGRSTWRSHMERERTRAFEAMFPTWKGTGQGAGTFTGGHLTDQVQTTTMHAVKQDATTNTSGEFFMQGTQEDVVMRDRTPKFHQGTQSGIEEWVQTQHYFSPVSSPTLGMGLQWAPQSPTLNWKEATRRVHPIWYSGQMSAPAVSRHAAMMGPGAVFKKRWTEPYWRMQFLKWDARAQVTVIPNCIPMSCPVRSWKKY